MGRENLADRVRSGQIGSGKGDPTRPVRGWKLPVTRPAPTREISKSTWPVGSWPEKTPAVNSAEQPQKQMGNA